MARLTLTTAGESHGRGLLAILGGLPHGIAIDVEAVDAALRRRQGGYGRSGRQKIESDRVEIVGGARCGVTLGGPLALLVKNADHRIDAYKSLSRPRPGHADLAGAQKYLIDDVGDVMERSSARETAVRVAAGAVCQGVLALFGVDVFAYVTRIAGIAFGGDDSDRIAARALRDASPFYSLDPGADALARVRLDELRSSGDTAGGRFRVSACGLPPGLGEPSPWDRRLGGRLAHALMSIQAIKAVEIGDGIDSADQPGSSFHDEILAPERGKLPMRRSNHAGGLEGGMTNGEILRLDAAMKPIPTLARPLASFDLQTGVAAPAVYERSDNCSVPAASVVGEAMVSFVLLDAFLDKFGGDTLADVRAAHESWRARLLEPPRS